MLGKQSSVDSIREKMTSFISLLVCPRKSGGRIPREEAYDYVKNHMSTQTHPLL